MGVTAGEREPARFEGVGAGALPLQSSSTPPRPSRDSFRAGPYRPGQFRVAVDGAIDRARAHRGSCCIVEPLRWGAMDWSAYNSPYRLGIVIPRTRALRLFVASTRRVEWSPNSQQGLDREGNSSFATVEPEIRLWFLGEQQWKVVDRTSNGRLRDDGFSWQPVLGRTIARLGRREDRLRAANDG
jgi:hypothetical protein